MEREGEAARRTGDVTWLKLSDKNITGSGHLMFQNGQKGRGSREPYCGLLFPCLFRGIPSYPSRRSSIWSAPPSRTLIRCSGWGWKGMGVGSEGRGSMWEKQTGW